MITLPKTVFEHARVSRFGHGRRAVPFPARPYVAIGNGGGGKSRTCVTWTNDDVVPLAESIKAAY
jgi:hypothetical protein